MIKLNLTQYLVRYKMQQVLFIILFWIMGLNLYVLIKYYGNDPNTGPGMLSGLVSIPYLFTMATLGGGLMGTLIGALEIFVYPKFVKKRSFGFSILLRSLIFIVAILIVTLFIIYFYYAQVSIDNSQVLSAALNYFWSAAFLSIVIYLLFLSVLMDFILQVNQRMGPGSIVNLLNGRYFKPREENRVFMFLDLTSSTTIAEQLGHIKFSQLLQDCFHDLSGLLLKHHASVYQFVGDEAVLTWRVNAKNGTNSCLNFFFEYGALLTSKESYYQKKYGLMPVFYAAVNAGVVTVAEVGDIKSEIAFHGDVLNVASRVQKLCKEYDEQILVTGDLKKCLTPGYVKLKKLDEIIVSGKELPVEIYSICHADELVEMETLTS